MIFRISKYLILSLCERKATKIAIKNIYAIVLVKTPRCLDVWKTDTPLYTDKTLKNIPHYIEKKLKRYLIGRLMNPYPFSVGGINLREQY